MSTQADRIKAFRLAQHARIQKEEDEEWISGEELCTEGSSDEDTASKPKCIHKKHKKTNKLGISPLALPNEEVGNVYQETTETASVVLPNINDNNRVVDKKVDNREDEAVEKHASLEESIKNNADMDFCMQWRPKRGSIKLPTVAEGQSTYNMAHYTNSFHRDMLLNLRNMRHKPTTKTIDDENGDLDSNFYLRLRFKRKILEDIERRDEEIDRLTEISEGMKRERLIEFGKTEKDVDNDDLLVSQVFTNFCQIDVNSDDNYHEGNEQNNEVNNSIEKKSTAKNKKFIDRNIKLSKQGRMATLSLTDEEKVKLDELLSDIDFEEEVDNPTSGIKDDHDNQETQFEITDYLDIDSIAENTKNSANPYKFEEKDERRLTEMETKIKEFLDTQADDVDQKPDRDDMFEKFYETGKLWKCEMVSKRLKEINKELTVIAENKSNEKVVDLEREVKGLDFEIGNVSEENEDVKDDEN